MKGRGRGLEEAARLPVRPPVCGESWPAGAAPAPRVLGHTSLLLCRPQRLEQPALPISCSKDSVRGVESVTGEWVTGEEPLLSPKGWSSLIQNRNRKEPNICLFCCQ